MTNTKARKIMRDENLYGNRNFKYINTYKIVKRFDDFEVIMYSEKTGAYITVYDHEDNGGYTGAHFTICNLYR